MNDFWLNILGYDAGRIPEGAETQFVWTHAPASWLALVAVVGAAALLYLVWWLYAREMAVCPRPVRIALAVVRMASMAVLAIVLLGPALAVSLRQSLAPSVLLLLDDSTSMGIRDAYEAPVAQRLAAATGLVPEGLQTRSLQRAELVDALLRKDDARFVRGLQTRGRVRVMTFSDRLTVRDALGLDADALVPVDVPPPEGGPPISKGPPVPPLDPSGPSTNLGRAIRDALRSVAGNPVAGIVLVSDGQKTSGPDPLAAADFAKAQGVPIMAVGVGDPRSPRNRRVADVWAPETVFRGDPFVLQARIQAHGADEGSVRVACVERRIDGPDAGAETVLDRQTVSLDADTGEATVSFRHEPRAEGRFVYAVRVEPGPDEWLQTDNQKATTVRVVGEKARVLVIAGSPTWDFRMVRTLFIRDKTIDVSCWLQSLDPDMRQDGNTVIERLPAKAEDLFAYDVVVLLDPDPSEFDESWIGLLRTFVGDHAGGLLWAMGPKHATRFFTSYRTREARDLLPVRLGDVATTDMRLFDRAHTRAWPMRFTADGVEHPLLQFAKDPDAARRAAEALPGVYWTYPATAAKPGATTLVEHGDPRLKVRDDWRPLLVAGQYGPGRVLYMGFDGTWRWRRLGEQTFDRFWVRALRFLLEGRLMGGKRRGRIATDRDVYPLGGRITVTARLYDAAFEPLAEPAVLAVVRAGPEVPPQEMTLRPVANRPGHYEGTFIAGHVGDGEIEVTLPDALGAKPIRLTRQVTVEPPRVEFQDPRLNRALLVDLAQRSGGRYFGIDEADALTAALPDRHETVVVREPPRALWDTWRLLAVLVTLLAVEWAVRKRFRLM